MAPPEEDDLVLRAGHVPGRHDHRTLEGEASGQEAACFVVGFPEGRKLVVTLADAETGEPSRMNLGLSPSETGEMRVIVGQLDEAAPLAPFTLNLSLE